MAKYTNRIQVNVSNTLRDRVSLEAKRMGVTVPEYVRYALLNELESVNTVDDIDRELLKQLPEALDDVKNGRIISADSLDEALNIYNSVSDDES
jgi:hypothetical protein